MKLSDQLLKFGLQKTLLSADSQTRTDIINYIPNWLDCCEKLIKTSVKIYNITQGKRNGHFWVTTKKENLTYGEVFSKMLDLGEELSEIYMSNWVFTHIMVHTEQGNWTLQNILTDEFTGARKLEFSDETSKMNQFLKGQRDLKWMIIHVSRFIQLGKTLLNS
jgi:hypothetical protein